eukprot:824313-Pyramimonas_sp.AAC.2
MAPKRVPKPKWLQTPKKPQWLRVGSPGTRLRFMKLMKQIKIKNMVIKTLGARLRSLKCAARGGVHHLQNAITRDSDHDRLDQQILERMEDEMSTDTDGISTGSE